MKKKEANVLENFKNIWIAIKASGDFDVIDLKVNALYVAFPAVLVKYDRVKNTYNNPANVLTADDYDSALTKVNAAVKDDDEMNKRFLAILQKYKL